ncbi:helix-turn-helix domain-containing protein [Flavobacterium sp.]|uniref:helix-turn-helix domain-containing protein n=1 Tax=Flavobacterium sp. TaxID=239 RepID=UPI0039E5A107
MNTTAKPRHIGRNISRLRELRGMKQEALALAIGVSQQTVSTIENSENVDEEKLIEIAKALEVSVEAIRNFSEENIFNYFSTYNDNSSGPITNNQCTFNPLDKLMEMVEENRKLYERLIEELKRK